MGKRYYYDDGKLMVLKDIAEAEGLSLDTLKMYFRNSKQETDQLRLDEAIVKTRFQMKKEEERSQIYLFHDGSKLNIKQEAEKLGITRNYFRKLFESLEGPAETRLALTTEIINKEREEEKKFLLSDGTKISFKGVAKENDIKNYSMELKQEFLIMEGNTPEERLTKAILLVKSRHTKKFEHIPGINFSEESRNLEEVYKIHVKGETIKKYYLEAEGNTPQEKLKNAIESIIKKKSEINWTKCGEECEVKGETFKRHFENAEGDTIEEKIENTIKAIQKKKNSINFEEYGRMCEVKGETFKRYFENAEGNTIEEKLKNAIKAIEEKKNSINFAEIARKYKIAWGTAFRCYERCGCNLEKTYLLLDKRKTEISKGEINTSMFVRTRKSNNLSDNNTSETSRRKKVMCKGISLYQYCLNNSLNYSSIYGILIKYFAKDINQEIDEASIEMAIERYKIFGQRPPIIWKYEKYEILLKHLMLKYNIDHHVLINLIREKNLTFEDALKRCVLVKKCKEMDQDFEIIELMYDFLDDNGILDDEVVSLFSVNNNEKKCLESSYKKIHNIMREKLLYEISELFNDTLMESQEFQILTFQEKKEILDVYNISLEEIEIIFLDLYRPFRDKVLIAEKEIENTKRLKIRNYTKKWFTMTQAEREDLYSDPYLTPQDIQYIQKTSNEMEKYKRAVLQNSKEKDMNQKIQ